MKGFLLSFRSEFYKTRKTMGFWSAVLLPLAICLLLFIGFFNKSDHLANIPGFMAWLQFAGAILAVMGSLLLPMLIVFIAYSVNSIEHKADTWKSLFSLPIAKLSIYSAKYFYALFLVFLCLALFVLFTIGFGDFLSVLKPQLKFNEYHIEKLLAQIYSNPNWIGADVSCTMLPMTLPVSVVTLLSLVKSNALLVAVPVSKKFGE